MILLILLFAICMTIIITLEFCFQNKLDKLEKEFCQDQKIKKEENQIIKLKRILNFLFIIRWAVFIIYFSFFSVNKLWG